MQKIYGKIDLCHTFRTNELVINWGVLFIFREDD